MSDTPGALGQWIRIYEVSGEMPPVGVLLKHLDEHDAEDARLRALLWQAKSALEAEHDAACEYENPCTRDNCAIAAALAAIREVLPEEEVRE